MNSVGWFSLEVAQEACDDLNLRSTHRHHSVSEVVLDHEIEECLGNDICGCCWHQAACSHHVAVLQLLRGDRLQVLGWRFHGIAQDIV